MGLVAWMDRTFYPDNQKNWDDLIFRNRIENHLTQESVVLDVGAGAGIVEAMHFRGKVAKMCGIDLDPRVLENDKLDEAKLANAGEIPYEDNLFDIVFADNVMEHLEDPVTVFSEINRVLKPGGVLLFKTPNRSHYMPLISRFTPFAFHRFYNRIRGRDETDTFPAFYRSNSKSQTFDLAKKTGMDVINIERIEGRPEYLRLTALTYAFGLIYERIVNAASFMERFRILLIATLRKPE